MRTILVVNDDGIGANGIQRLAKALTKYGKVYVIAPEKERSAASHSIVFRRPIAVEPYDFPVEGVTAYTCDGQPADCVRLGCLALLPEKPDVVFSGINHGYNVGTDIQYSATVGAAFEADYLGCHAVAVSEGMFDANVVTDAYLDEIIAKTIDMEVPKGYIINVNVPDGDLSEIKGFKTGVTVAREYFHEDTYTKVEEMENGGMKFEVSGVLVNNVIPGTDYEAVFNKYISVGIVSNIGVDTTFSV